MSPRTGFVAPTEGVRRGGSIHRDALIDRALELADQDGLEAITIRRLATDFGVTPMALYWHVKSKDELLAAMGDRIFAGLDLVSVDPQAPWITRLQTLMTRLVDALRAHPASAVLAGPQILQCADGLALTEMALAALAEGGFSVVERSEIAHTAMITALSLVTAEPGTEWELPGEQRESTLAAKRAAAQSLSPEQFPNIRQCVDSLLDCDDIDRYYATALRIFVGGVQSAAPARS